MLELLKSTIAGQFDAALCTLAFAIEDCPDDTWHALVAKYRFDRLAFHATFYGDVYLGPNLAALREQPFHREHAAFFGDYEELENRPPVSDYERPAVLEYVAHVRRKAAEVIPAETAESLAVRPGFDWLDIPRAEVHVYNLRHLQHHAAQLGLRSRLDADVDLPWCRSGWRERAR